jgi:hypothetical protein
MPQFVDLSYGHPEPDHAKETVREKSVKSAALQPPGQKYDMSAWCGSCRHHKLIAVQLFLKLKPPIR